MSQRGGQSAISIPSIWRQRSGNGAASLAVRSSILALALRRLMGKRSIRSQVRSPPVQFSVAATLNPARAASSSAALRPN